MDSMPELESKVLVWPMGDTFPFMGHAVGVAGTINCQVMVIVLVEGHGSFVVDPQLITSANSTLVALASGAYLSLQFGHA